MSPDDNKSSHMVLTLDLTQYATYVKLVDEVVSQFGKVCGKFVVFIIYGIVDDKALAKAKYHAAQNFGGFPVNRQSFIHQIL